MEIKKLLLTNKLTRPALRDESYKRDKVTGLVIHWTANIKPGADAEANRNYFNNLEDKKASAHYIVDSKEIIQCVPDLEVAYHAGSFTANREMIGIEMYVNNDGDFNKTYWRTVELVKHLMKKHKLHYLQVHRHYDITGKDCPKMLLPILGHEWNWELFLYNITYKKDACKIFFRGITSDSTALYNERNKILFIITCRRKKGRRFIFR